MWRADGGGGGVRGLPGGLLLKNKGVCGKELKVTGKKAKVHSLVQRVKKEMKVMWVTSHTSARKR